jgi:hypothetical protein
VSLLAVFSKKTMTNPLNLIYPKSAYAANPITGNITPPGTIITNLNQVGNFLSVLVGIIVIVAGLWAFLEFILGGLGYITAGGDSKKAQDAFSRIRLAIIGLIAIAAAFIISGILGQVFFGNPMFILNPQIQTL